MKNKHLSYTRSRKTDINLHQRIALGALLILASMPVSALKLEMTSAIQKGEVTCFAMLEVNEQLDLARYYTPWLNKDKPTFEITLPSTQQYKNKIKTASIVISCKSTHVDGASGDTSVELEKKIIDNWDKALMKCSVSSKGDNTVNSVDIDCR